MKLVTFRVGNMELGGILAGDQVIDMEAAFRWYESRAGNDSSTNATNEKYGQGVLGFIQHATDARPVAEELVALCNSAQLPTVFSDDPLTHSLSNVSLVSPIPRPPSMRDGYAFRQHVATARKNRGLEMIPEFDQFPVFYFTNHQAVIGNGDLHVLEKHLDRLDYELEAAIVVGKRGRNVPANRADELIFGMTIMNDFSARALQMQEMTLSLGPAKGKDFATALGPVLVTMDELTAQTKASASGNIFDLKMSARLNGKELSTGNVKDMSWTFAQILERASYGVTLYPGDVIGSGTCGTGCLLELNGSKVTDNLWLKVGDEIELEIQGIGKLTNKVVKDVGAPEIH
ncbi:MAG: fumarylacetoacetate hydrolase family protein [Polyangiaceae bacterium]